MANRVYTTAIAIAASISKAFKGDALNAASALGKLTEATKKLQSAEKAAASFKRLDDAVSRSKGRYDQATAALRRLEEAERAAGGATKESTAWRKAGEREVAKAAREFDRSTKAAEKNGKALREMGVDTSRLASEQERLARTLAATERQQKAMERIEGARERVFGKRSDPVPLAQKAGAQLRGLAGEAMMLGTAALGAGAALSHIVLKSIEAGDEIGDTADKIGISAKALQELRYGAKQSGAETADLDKALGKMLVTVGRFKNAKASGGGGGAGLAIPGLQTLGTGGSEASGAGGDADPFKRIGLNAKELAALKPDEQLKKIADGLSKLKTRADKAAAAQAIFGKAAISLQPLLDQGTEGIDKLSVAANRFGGVMSDEAVKAAGEADLAMNDAKMAVAGLTNTLGGALLPTATKVLGQFSSWLASNRGAIQAWAQSAATWIEGRGIPALVRIGAEAKAFGEKLFALVNGAASLVGGFGNLGIAVGALRLAPLAVTFGQIGIQGAKAAIAVAQFMMSANAGALAPLAAMGASLGAIALAAGAVGVAIYRIVDAVKELGGVGAVWQDIKDFVGSGGMMTPAGARSPGYISEEDFNKKYGGAGYKLKEPSAVPFTGGGGPGIGKLEIGVSVGEGPRDQVTRDLDTGLARARQQALDAFDRRQANQRRVSFAE